ncbi:hypothetical protein MAPG_10777 [Magnaporthiopsis poae ATCC 64411]|uniref:Uncharacterized protein n=1 Tax=Magnaporthiopsis poae (strain ATCC 64411 / 73-15) TaxID=644358 RepID=A0A0C4EDH7_MAGP6|nr:hypothetical protein MAPG_10777 [Magnaporthiopsis poae ATCC 64411]
MYDVTTSGHDRRFTIGRLRPEALDTHLGCPGSLWARLAASMGDRSRKAAEPLGLGLSVRPARYRADLPSVDSPERKGNCQETSPAVEATSDGLGQGGVGRSPLELPTWSVELGSLSLRYKAIESMYGLCIDPHGLINTLVTLDITATLLDSNNVGQLVNHLNWLSTLPHPERERPDPAAVLRWGE